MRKRKHVLTIAAAVVLLSACSSANAVTFDFANLKDANQATPNSGDFDPNEAGGTAWALNNDWVSSNTKNGVFGGSLSWTVDGITVKATASYKDKTASVIQDHWDSSGKAGLGVYHKKNDTSDDNVSKDETLTLSFDQEISLTGLTFRDKIHKVLNKGSFHFGVDGDAAILRSFNALDSVMGTTFSFAYYDKEEFYLSTMSATTVPDGGTTAVLMGLSALGLGLMGRKRAAN